MRKNKSRIYFRTQNVNKAGKCVVNLHYVANHAQRKMSIAFQVEPGWDEAHNEDEVLAYMMDDYRQRIRHIERKIIESGKDLIASDVLMALKEPIYGRTSDNICEFIRKWIAKSRETKRVKESTLYNYDLVRKILMQWGDDMTFKNMDDKSLEAFESWMISQKYKNTTTSQVMRNLLSVMRKAEKAELTVHQSYKNFDPIEATEDDCIIALTSDEVDKLMALDLKGSLDCVRDMFVWACATGQRYSDVVNVEWRNVSNNMLTYISIKTGMKTEVFLNPTSQWVLNKNKGKEHIVPRKTKQKCNIEIKEICKLAGIDEMVEVAHEIGNERVIEAFPKWQLITFHTSRRSFATKCIELGMPDVMVMKSTGHKDHKNFRKYVGVSYAMQESFMARWK